MKTTDLYICECGNVFDDWETYEDLPKFGLKQKALIGFGGKPIKDIDGNIIYVKCHICRKTKKKTKNDKCLADTILEYLTEHDYITTEMWEDFGFRSRASMSSTLHAMYKQGKMGKLSGYHRPQKYFLKKT